jgi:hypothetical protein
MSKAVPNSDSFQSCKEPFIVFCFISNLQSNSRCVFASIALSKNEERVLSSDIDPLEASAWIVVELLKSAIEVISKLSLICYVSIWEKRISIAQTSSDRLINKDDIVVLSPTVLVADDVIGSVGRFNYPEWP